MMEAWVGGAMAACSAGVAMVITRGVRELALRRRLLDLPNARSAHTVPTPRLGGIGIVVPFLAASAAWVAMHGGGANRPALLVLACTAAISVLGAADDLRPLPVRWRAAAQAVAAVVVVLSRGPAIRPALAPFGDLLPYPVLAAVAILWIVWATNLYNFMDGIDGLAGGQAVWASAGLAAAALASGGTAVAWMLIFLAASAAGFLRYNLPKASIFMGDVGSMAIGFFLASVPFGSADGALPVLTVVLALSLFILDATTTLIRRVARGERWFEAHRTHLYQRPLTHGVSHARINYSAYGGMALVSAMAALHPHLGAAGRGAAFALAGGLFLVARAVVVRLERQPTRTERGTAAQ